uniref:helix-turn-helix domain-containing protein n=1 Tax=Lentzea kentuckyensis TaxID=360086 RepID=UPI00117AE581
MREFGELLRTHRIHAGLTQQQLADFAMVSVRAIRDLECGRTRSPRAETVRLLADGLRLDEGNRATLQQAGGRPAGPVPVAPPAPSAVVLGREMEVAALTDLLAADGAGAVGPASVAGRGSAAGRAAAAGGAYVAGHAVGDGAGAGRGADAVSAAGLVE